MTVTGESAVAVCESLVFVHDADCCRVWWCTANHFALRQIDGAGQITMRTSRVRDGDPGAHGLLSKRLARVPAGLRDGGDGLQ